MRIIFSNLGIIKALLQTLNETCQNKKEVLQFIVCVVLTGIWTDQYDQMMR